MRRERIHQFLRIAAAAALAFLFSAVASAHGPFGTLSERGYERMRELAHDLDGQARHAADQAVHQESWFYLHDRQFVRSVIAFARRASQFHARMDNYRTAPWQVDDELRSLLRDAERVESRLLRSRYADDHTVSDWNEVVRTLNEMIRTFRADTGVDRFGSPAYHAAPPPPEYRREERGYAPEGPGRFERGDLVPLAHELADHAAALSAAVGQSANPSIFDSSQVAAIAAIQRFSADAASFNERLERGMSAGELQDNVARLSDEGRSADRQVRARDLPRQIRDDWSAVMTLLQRLATTAY